MSKTDTIDQGRRRVGATLACGLAAPIIVACSGGSGDANGIAGAGDTTASDGSSQTGTAQDASVAFRGNVVLGAPTATSIRANVYAADQNGTISIAYGTRTGAPDHATVTLPLTAGRPTELPIEGLTPNTRYFYRLTYRGTSGSVSGITPENTFHTARAPGSAFTFTIQGDSHPERSNSQFDATLYARTLSLAAADTPDLHIAMGDDFSVDTLDAATVSMTKVTERYALQRPWLSIVGASAPLVLVNGNHEQAARYLLDGTPDNVAVWAQNARNAFYPQPAPDRFYSGNPEQVPFIGLLRNWFAWTWGDALFVVIDPYWSSPDCVDAPFGGGAKRTDLWEITFGDLQYQWLKTTLESSTAKYKFVFSHHVLGTGRGGAAVAGWGEWGGLNTNGSAAFATKRPGWAEPIHRLMVQSGVTIFFQGHDHIWARETLDGVTYQTLPEPADPHYALYNADAYPSADRLPNTGYTRVSVSASGVLVEYVRTWLPADEGPDRRSGMVAFSYRLA